MNPETMLLSAYTILPGYLDGEYVEESVGLKRGPGTLVILVVGTQRRLLPVSKIKLKF
jgi:hypothetical protein